MKKGKEYVIQVNGYTDYLAGDAYNKTLSCKRANEIKAFLIKNGVNRLRVLTKGKGKLPPYLKNNKEGIQKNRKSEILVYYKTKNNTKTISNTNNTSENNTKTISNTTITSQNNTITTPNNTIINDEYFSDCRIYNVKTRK